MKYLHRLTMLLLCCILPISLFGCSPSPVSAEDQTIRITATTYPLYILTSAIAAGADHVVVERLNTGEVSCLHDYTLTVSDMRRLEQADLLILNGAGLEEFLGQALSQLHAVQIDCSEAVHLLEGDSHEAHSETYHEGESDHHHSHDHSHEHDPHYWMDPRNLIHAADAISDALCTADPDGQSLYQSNTEAVCAALEDTCIRWQTALSQISVPYLITFHDGFYYFAESFGLEILFSMEEEDGATASAKDIRTASTFVKEYDLSAIFTEVNGSGTAARAVSGETGATVFQLSMLMSGADAPVNADAVTILKLYLTPMEDNIRTLSEVLK